MNKTKKKRLFFDIETSPNIGFFWSAGYKLNVPYDNIIKERAIICICYKWEGEDKVYSLQWDKDQNDKIMLEQFIIVANEAHELVGHNGDRYDLPWIRTRCLFHGIPCFPTYTTIDTLKQSRSKFRFNSNRLDYIAQFLGVGEKSETGGFDLWKDIVLNNSKTAMKTMIEYCKNDVVILEKVFQHIKNYVPHKTHFGALETGEKTCCPECGSDNLRHSQTRYTAAGTPRVQVQCNDCHKYHTVASRTYDAIIAKQFEGEEEE
jgi:predicted PolB exonuclease-like 3'-5' exonuclease